MEARFQTLLFNVILKPASEVAVTAFLDGLELFGIGCSWGGYESLVIPFDDSTYRAATRWAPDGPALRFSVRLEDIEDLEADLGRGFATLGGAVLVHSAGALPAQAVDEAGADIGYGVGRFERRQMSDPCVDTESRPGQEAREGFAQQRLALDLIPVANDHDRRRRNSDELLADVLHHASPCPGAFGSGRAGERVLDHLLAQGVGQRPTGENRKRLLDAFP